MDQKTEYYLDGFGHMIPVRCKEAKTSLREEDKYIVQTGLELDKETGSTHVVETGKVDVNELIQSYKDSCGMEMVKKMLAAGADASQFADDGKHSGDATGPSDINTAFELAQEGNIAGQQLANQLGLDFDKVKGLSDDELKSYIVSALTASQGQAQTQETVTGGKE